MTTKLEQAVRHALDTSLRVDQYSEEMLGDDGMVMVVPLDAYNDMMEAISTLQEALEHSGEVNKMVIDWYSLTGSTRRWGEGMVEAMFSVGNDNVVYVITHESVKDIAINYLPVYAAPVRTKDLTDDEIYTLYSEPCSDREMVEFARAVIAADREKNNANNNT